MVDQGAVIVLGGRRHVEREREATIRRHSSASRQTAADRCHRHLLSLVSVVCGTKLEEEAPQDPRPKTQDPRPKTQDPNVQPTTRAPRSRPWGPSSARHSNSDLTSPRYSFTMTASPDHTTLAAHRRQLNFHFAAASSSLFQAEAEPVHGAFHLCSLGIPIESFLWVPPPAIFFFFLPGQVISAINSAACPCPALVYMSIA
ncbi:hypothetical protein EV126DRAFT_137046 [Verticillium dahliae]|nr:hypothetical protein EV126DRAFT_137046 [Verticillium dahliae]